MYNGEIIIANGDNLACTNHATFSIQQKLSADRKSQHRVCYIEAQRLFVYDGNFSVNDVISGVMRLEIAEKEVTQYFTGVMLSLNMGLAKIRLDGELQDNNVETFLKKIERNEFSR